MPVVDNHPSPDKTLRYSVIAASSLALASLGDAFLYVYLPANYQSIGLPVFWVGLILSANRFTRLFLNGTIAFQISRHGIRNVALISTVLAVITTFSYGFIYAGWLWVLVRILWGITFSTLRLGTTLYALQHRRKGISLGLSKSIIALGPILALTLGPVILNYFSREITFALFAAISSLSVIAILLLPKLEIQSLQKKDLLPSFPSSYNKLVFLNAFVVEGMMVVQLSLLLAPDKTISPELLLIITGFWLGYRRLCLVLFSPVAGWMADRWGFDRIFNYTTLLIISGIVCITLGWISAGISIAFTASAMNASISPGGAANQSDNMIREISDNATWRDFGTAGGTMTGALLLDFSYLQQTYMTALIFLTIGLTVHLMYSKKQKFSHETR